MTDRNATHVARNFTGPSRATAIRGLFGFAALLSFGLSVTLYFTSDEMNGIFVGLWVPSILALGAFLAPRTEDPR
jgi:hypothetical protein